jgi:hypothetical protein
MVASTRRTVTTDTTVIPHATICLFDMQLIPFRVPVLPPAAPRSLMSPVSDSQRAQYLQVVSVSLALDLRITSQVCTASIRSTALLSPTTTRLFLHLHLRRQTMAWCTSSSIHLCLPVPLVRLRPFAAQDFLRRAPKIFMTANFVVFLWPR